MALQKQNLAIPFSTGIDTLTDSIQIMPTMLADLQNCVYTKDKQLNKRNGFRLLTSLPNGVNATTLTTFKGNLTAIGSSLQSFNEVASTWVDHGRFQSVALSTVPLVRSSSNQSALDAVVADGLVCSTWTDSDGTQKYEISDVVTTQVLSGPTNLPTGATNSRVFTIGNWFVITYLITITATPHLQFIPVPIGNITNPGSAVDVSSQVKAVPTGYDGYVANNYLYLAWNGSDMGGAIRARFYNVNLQPQGLVATAGVSADLISVTADASEVWVSWSSLSMGTTTISTMAFTPLLSPTLVPTTVTSFSGSITNISSTPLTHAVKIYWELSQTYSFSSVRSDQINYATCTNTGTPGTPGTVLLSVGLASKPFVINSTVYMLAAYAGTFQPTYFLIDDVGNVVAKLSYSNGGGYVANQVLPNVTVIGNVASIAYQTADIEFPISKAQGNSSGNIFSQFGANLVSFDLTPTNLSTAEIGNNLHIAGGFVWMYDGLSTVEHNFHLWPEDILATPSTMGGNLIDQTYFYQITYEWTDNQGNVHRSAPSIPVKAVVSGGGGSGSVLLDIPTLRLTYKKDVRVVIYRWSTAQQSYYQETYVTSPLLNDPTVNSITYTDVFADATILGTLLIYTTGGVVENIAYPATSALGLFKSRLFIINSEDPDQAWFSKQVIEATPVEPSDLFTMFVAPTISAQGSTGSTKALAAMDDKLVFFKPNAIYYITGDGPDNLGSNNDFSDPIFIASTVGTSDQKSIVFIPSGLLFQSDKGIWLLDRGLGTTYQGALVAGFNNQTVTSSINVPGTNQVRFTLNDNLALMYDYFFNRWGTFTNISAQSSTLYQGMHTYLDPQQRILQESVAFYQDNNTPTLMAWETAWINLAGVQGFERAYMCYIIGQYISPHKLYVEISYDYANGVTQSFVLSPSNYAGTYATTISYFGQGVFGGAGTLEQWRIFLQQQKVQAFKVRVQEQFDSSFGTEPGAGLTFSGLNLVVGLKKGYVPLSASQSAS